MFPSYTGGGGRSHGPWRQVEAPDSCFGVRAETEHAVTSTAMTQNRSLTWMSWFSRSRTTTVHTVARMRRGQWHLRPSQPRHSAEDVLKDAIDPRASESGPLHQPVPDPHH